MSPRCWICFLAGVVGWSMDKNIDRHLVIQALMMAVWKRQPKERVWSIVIKEASTAAATTSLSQRE